VGLDYLFSQSALTKPMTLKDEWSHLHGESPASCVRS